MSSLSVCLSAWKRYIGKGKRWRCRFIGWYQVWRPIIRLYPLVTPWSLDLFIRVPFQLHGEHTVLQPFRCIELRPYRIHFHLCPTRYSFSPESSEAFEGEVTCLSTQHLNNVPKIERGETWYFSENSEPSGIRNRTTGSERHALTISPCHFLNR